MLKINDDKCTGCTLCGQICPTGAITYEVRNGFRYPVVSKEKCIDCDLCMKKCPALNRESTSNKYPAVYAAWSKDTGQREQCTSGGICYEISKYVLENGGCVAGVAWCDHYRNAEYKLITSINELQLITQTKYFQPEMGNIYEEVKGVLAEGKTVLYIGTACTNAALRYYVGDRLSENLICCDFICRGYSSQKYHQKRIEYLETEYRSPVSNVQYKNKTKGWRNFGTKFEFQNGKSYYVNQYDDPYEIMFHRDDFNTRPSCFDCKYRENPRLCDITVGDFWAIKNIDNEILKNGVSAVMVNSERGQKLFEGISDRIQFEERNLWEVSKGNYALLHQLHRKEGAEAFFHDLETRSIPYIHNKYGRNRRKEALIRKIKKVVSIILKCRPLQFVHYNYFCSGVKRDKRCYMIPYRGTRINIEKGGKLVLHSSLYVNTNRHKHSHEEVYLHIYRNGKYEINGIVQLAAGNTLDVLPDAELTMGKTDTNYGTVIVCSNKITMGDDIGIGRNVMIYDSNYHPTGINKSVKGKPLVIEDHVWLCSGVTIAKGLRIGAGAICGLNSTVTRNVKSRHMVLGNPAKDVMSDVEW